MRSDAQVDTVAGLASDHLHKRQAEGEGVKPRPRMVRVGKELASLSVSLFIHGTHLSSLQSRLFTLAQVLVYAIPVSAYCSSFEQGLS